MPFVEEYKYEVFGYQLTKNFMPGKETDFFWNIATSDERNDMILDCCRYHDKWDKKTTSFLKHYNPLKDPNNTN